jgi:integrase
MPRSPTIVCSSIPPLQCRSRRNAKSPHAIYRRVRLSALVDEMPPRYCALVLVGAYAGLRWGEAAGLRRRDIDPLRSRIRITYTAVELRGRVTLDNEPKTTRSKRSVPVARSVMRRLELHLSEFVEPTSDALVFTVPSGGPLFRVWGRRVFAAGRAARRVGRHHFPWTSAQLCRDHGGRRLQRTRGLRWAGTTALRSR